MKQLDLFRVYMAPDVPDRIRDVINSGTVTQGPVNKAYEQALEQYFNVQDKIVTVNSATSGLTLALRLLDLPKGSKVLCTPLTCTATNWPVLANNLDIQWVDVDPQTANMCLTDLKRKLTADTRAVLFVHWGGYPIDAIALSEIKNYYQDTFNQELFIIGDCAHAFGAEYPSGAKVGSVEGITTMDVFSTQAIKTLSTGDGGYIIIHNDKDKEMYKRAKKMSWFGISREPITKGDFRIEADITHWGYKFHMNDINSAIGLENLKFVDGNLVKIRAIANYYNEMLKDVKGVELLKIVDMYVPAYWIYTIKIESDKPGFMNFMKERGIMTSQVHGRCDKHSTVSDYQCDLPQLDELEKKIVCIPCGWWIEQEDAAFIVESIKTFCASNDIQIRPLDVDRDWQGYLNLITLLNKQDATNYDKETFITKYNKIQSESSTVYVMLMGDKIVGTGKLHIETKFFDSIGHIEDLVIDTEYRKLNLGKKLVQFLVDSALNYKKCYKCTLNANEDVTDFYKKCDLSVDGCTVSQTYRLES